MALQKVKARMVDDDVFSVFGIDPIIDNGDFQICQRGTTVAAGTGIRFGPDRWALIATGSTVASSRQSFTPGQLDVPGEPEFFLRVVAATIGGSGNCVRVVQAIEDVRTLAGQDALLSFWAKAGTAQNISVEFEQSFGSGGSASAAVTAIDVQKIALTTAWSQKFIPVSVPSISGKIIGTSETDALKVNIWLDAGAAFNARTDTLGQQSGTFDIADVMLLPSDGLGAKGVPFRRSRFDAVLRRCMRFFQKTFGVGVAPTQNAGAGTGEFQWQVVLSGTGAHITPTLFFNPPMRSAPSVTLYNSEATNAEVRNKSQAVNATGSTALLITPRSFVVQCTGHSSGVSGATHAIHYAAEAEIT